MTGDAVFDETGRYRYRLDRFWGSGPALAFVGLNPNTADATADDPTIRRCVGFARDAGCGRLVVVNLFAWRCRHPADLRTVPDPVGPDNDAHLLRAAAEAERVVACWGNHGALHDRALAVRALLGDLWCLGVNQTGEPRHPLYLPRDTPLIRLREPGGSPA